MYYRSWQKTSWQQDKEEEMDGVIGFSNYKQYKESLDQELSRSAESFVRIGYLLKVARDTNILY